VTKIKAIACEVMRDEWDSVNKQGIETCFLEQGLHRHPDDLHRKLQQAIDETVDCDTILLGYGLCSNALVGLRADKTLVVPLVEDCIGLFLGSAAAYYEEFSREPATYYFAKGWIVNKKDPYQEYLRCLELWGEEDARWVAGEMMKNYKRATYIDTHCYDPAEYIAYSRHFAAFFNLRHEEMSGTLSYFQDILSSRWDRCLIVPPGETISETTFRAALDAAAKCRKD
jgi:hypothetical protein